MKKKHNVKNILANMDMPLLYLTFIMFGIGLLSIVTASSREAIGTGQTLFHYFYRQLSMLTIGAFLSYFILKIPTKKYNKLVWIGYLILVIILIYLLFSGTATRGALNWVSIMGIRFQPSEFSKPVIIVALALLLENKNKTIEKDDPAAMTNFLVTYGIIGLVIPAIVFLQKDLGTMTIIVSAVFMLFIASPISKLHKYKSILILSAVSLLAMTGLYLRQGYILSEAQMQRFDFYNPCSKYETSGYQICNGYIAINDGGLFGLGIGKSKQKYSYIPEPHTDSIFAIMTEEFGLILVTMIIIGYIIILKRILNIAAEAHNLRGRYIALGIATMLFTQIVINLGGLFGMIPLTGVPLPFMSYGGSFTITLMVSLALVQRVHIEKRTAKIQIKS